MTLTAKEHALTAVALFLKFISPKACHSMALGSVFRLHLERQVLRRLGADVAPNRGVVVRDGVEGRLPQSLRQEWLVKAKATAIGLRLIVIRLSNYTSLNRHHRAKTGKLYAKAESFIRQAF